MPTYSTSANANFSTPTGAIYIAPNDSLRSQQQANMSTNKGAVYVSPNGKVYPLAGGTGNSSGSGQSSSASNAPNSGRELMTPLPEPMTPIPAKPVITGVREGQMSYAGLPDNSFPLPPEIAQYDAMGYYTYNTNPAGKKEVTGFAYQTFVDPNNPYGGSKLQVIGRPQLDQYRAQYADQQARVQQLNANASKVANNPNLIYGQSTPTGYEAQFAAPITYDESVLGNLQTKTNQIQLGLGVSQTPANRVNGLPNPQPTPSPVEVVEPPFNPLVARANIERGFAGVEAIPIIGDLDRLDRSIQMVSENYIKPIPLGVGAFVGTGISILSGSTVGAVPGALKTGIILGEAAKQPRYLETAGKGLQTTGEYISTKATTDPLGLIGETAGFGAGLLLTNKAIAFAGVKTTAGINKVQTRLAPKVVELPPEPMIGGLPKGMLEAREFSVQNNLPRAPPLKGVIGERITTELIETPNVVRSSTGSTEIITKFPRLSTLVEDAGVAGKRTGTLTAKQFAIENNQVAARTQAALRVKDEGTLQIPALRGIIGTEPIGLTPQEASAGNLFKNALRGEAYELNARGTLTTGSSDRFISQYFKGQPINPFLQTNIFSSTGSAGASVKILSILDYLAPAKVGGLKGSNKFTTISGKLIDLQTLEAKRGLVRAARDPQTRALLKELRQRQENPEMFGQKIVGGKKTSLNLISKEVIKNSQTEPRNFGGSVFEITAEERSFLDKLSQRPKDVKPPSSYPNQKAIGYDGGGLSSSGGGGQVQLTLPKTSTADVAGLEVRVTRVLRAPSPEPARLLFEKPAVSRFAEITPSISKLGNPSIFSNPSISRQQTRQRQRNPIDEVFDQKQPVPEKTSSSEKLVNPSIFVPITINPFKEFTPSEPIPRPRQDEPVPFIPDFPNDNPRGRKFQFGKILPSISLGGGGGSVFGSGTRLKGRRTKYTSTLQAAYFGIKSKNVNVNKIFTGLEQRPLISLNLKGKKKTLNAFGKQKRKR